MKFNQETTEAAKQIAESNGHTFINRRLCNVDGVRVRVSTLWPTNGIGVSPAALVRWTSKRYSPIDYKKETIGRGVRGSLTMEAAIDCPWWLRKAFDIRQDVFPNDPAISEAIQGLAQHEISNR